MTTPRWFTGRRYPLVDTAYYEAALGFRAIAKWENPDHYETLMTLLPTEERGDQWRKKRYATMEGRWRGSQSSTALVHAAIS